VSQRDLGREIAELLGERLQIEVPAPDTDLFAGGLLDSLGLVDLLVQLEARLAVRLTLESADLEDFRTVSRIAAFVSAQGGAPRALDAERTDP
jgi:acyl carrier protein